MKRRRKTFAKLRRTATLESLESRRLLTTFTVTETDGAGDGTLHRAIEAANLNPGLDTIEFDLAGDSPFTIELSEDLPEITDAVMIDGTSQAGFSSSPVVEIVNGGPVATVFRVSGGGSTFRGFSIHGFSGLAFEITGAGGNTIVGNYIGVGLDGEVAGTMDSGVYITNSEGNRIGGTSVADRNVISNSFFGVAIVGVVATDTVIQGNYIGTNSAGDSWLPNVASVMVIDGDRTQVGGSNVGEGNLITATDFDVEIRNASGSVVQGNLIGLNASGDAALGERNSLAIFAGDASVTIGGTEEGARNVVSNRAQAVVLEGQGRSTVQGNYFGTDVTGTRSIPNDIGLTTFGSSANQIGGTEANAGNLFSSSNRDISLLQFESFGTVIQGNRLGVNGSANEALGSLGEYGIVLEGALASIIGGAFEGAGNVIANRRVGILLTGDSAFDTVIQGNYIGTTPSGPLSRRGDIGIELNNGASHTRIGGDRVEAGNTIGNNRRFGILARDGEENYFRNNHFERNGVAIDLDENGANRNDIGDVDEGTNRLQNRLEQLQVFQAGDDQLGFRGSLQVSELASFPFTIDLYKTNSTVSTVEDLVATYVCRNRDSCQVDFETGILDTTWANVPLNMSRSVSVGDWVTAMVTDASFNSSEFSSAAIVTQEISPDPVDSRLDTAGLSEGFETVDDERRAAMAPGQRRTWADGSIHTFGDEDYYEIDLTPEVGQRLAGTFVVELQADVQRDVSDDGALLGDPLKGDLRLRVFDVSTNSPDLILESNRPGDLERIAFPVFTRQTASDVVKYAVVVSGRFGDINDAYELRVELRADDPDADGLLTGWETAGVIPYGTDGEVAFGTSPSIDFRDLYVEVDSMTGREPSMLLRGSPLWEHIWTKYPGLRQRLDVIDQLNDQPNAAVRLTGTVLDLVIAAFYDAPAQAGTTERIHLHIECRDQLDGLKNAGCDSRIPRRQFRSWDDVLALRDEHFGTPAQQSIWASERATGRPVGELAKKNAYRYAIFGDRLANASDFGRASIKSNEFVVTMGTPEQRNLSEFDYAVHQAAIFMHELGHTLALDHGHGVEDLTNYVSVMNYAYLLPQPRREAEYVLDYSDEAGIDDWEEVIFQFTYTEAIQQGDASTEGPPCATGLSDERVRSVPTEPTEPDQTWIDVPWYLEGQNAIDECYFGIERPYFFDFPLAGIITTTVSVKRAEPDDVQLSLELDVRGDSFVVEVDTPYQQVMEHNGRVPLSLTIAEDDRFNSFTGYPFAIEFQVDAASMVSIENIDRFRQLARNSYVPSLDLNLDRVLDEADFEEFLAFLSDASEFDIREGDTNLDGRVDAVDYQTVLDNLGKSGGWADGNFIFDPTDFGESALVTNEDLQAVVRNLDDPSILAANCDLNQDSACDIVDLEILNQRIAAAREEPVGAVYDPRFDFNRNGRLDVGDRSGWVDDRNTRPGPALTPGDANLDGLFDSADLILAFSAGEYEDDQSENSTWSEGDWNHDGEFDSSDLIAAFRVGNYETPAAVRPIAAAIEAWLGDQEDSHFLDSKLGRRR